MASKIEDGKRIYHQAKGKSMEAIISNEITTRSQPLMEICTQGQLLIDYKSLATRMESLQEDFAKAEPFPHVVIENFLPSSTIEKLLAEFPHPDSPLAWRKHYVEPKPGQIAQANKLGFSDLNELGPNLRQIFWELNSEHFLKCMEKLSGIDNLIGDPRLDGGGIHQSMAGAVLAIHADFSNHPVYKLDRRLNIIIFLNPDWNEDWGGHLELWDKKMTRCEKKVAPLLNRAVIFRTTQDSYHGHPHPLKTPEGVTRKSLALYYYSNGRPEHENDGEHGTLWQELPGQIKMPEQSKEPELITRDSSENSLKNRISRLADKLLR